jgi:S-adenosylmethionine decarboxylase proenzyme
MRDKFDHYMFEVTLPDGMSNNEVLSIFHGAIDASGAHIRNTTSHEFFPHGLTAMAVLAESHATIHTWPEKNIALVDYFTCSNLVDKDEFVNYFDEHGLTVFRMGIVHLER